MTALEKINNIQKQNNSLLCVGLDSDLSKIPEHLGNDVDALLEFNKAIIDSTKDLVCAYKINYAFYEQYGVEGFKVLKETFDYIPKDIFTIADAKRGDIGNTSSAYAKSVFEYFKADSITVNPYMGKDSVAPFLEFKDKMVFLLAITSNSGSNDFQRIVSNGKSLYQSVIETSMNWSGKEQLGYVIGATHPQELKDIRKIIPEHCLLIPGIGSQGGSIGDAISANSGGPAIINVSRDIIYASKDTNFADAVRKKTEYYRNAFNSAGK
ncbi:MAG: orotidine-5'-phosphate decarboxylase [bacterium]